MVDNYYPNVLIIGHYPGDFSGVSITLNNLFSQWPPEKLFVASCDPINKMLSKRVSHYYHFGHNESRIRLFGYFSRSKNVSQILSLETDKLCEMLNSNSNKTRLLTKANSHNFIKSLLRKTGISFILRKYCVSQDFLKWIQNLKPDIIFTMLGDVSTMDFAIELKNKTGLKLAVYILDDWVHANPANTLFPKIWGSAFSKKFEKVLKFSDINLVICEKMAYEYSCIYKKNFLYFHNPVDITLFKHYNQKDHDKFIISYLGKINRETLEGLKDLVFALNLLGNPNILLYIYPGTESNYLNKLVVNNKNIQIKKYIPHSNIQLVYQNSDLLFLPLGFTKKSRRYTRLSMPTKTTEYMASMVPILLYAPPEIALTEYALNNNFAIILSEKSPLKLKLIIEDIYNGKINTDLIIKNAYTLAQEKHNMEFICESFRKALSGESIA